MACSRECPSHRGGCGEFSVRGPCPGHFQTIYKWIFVRSQIWISIPVLPGRSWSLHFIPGAPRIFGFKSIPCFRSRSLPNLFLCMCICRPILVTYEYTPSPPLRIRASRFRASPLVNFFFNFYRRHAPGSVPPPGVGVASFPCGAPARDAFGIRFHTK